MKNGKNRERGQVLAEFAVMTAMVLSVALMLLFFLAVYSEYAWRLVTLIGWEPSE